MQKFQYFGTFLIAQPCSLIFSEIRGSVAKHKQNLELNLSTYRYG